MKKTQEICPACTRRTTHRVKRKAAIGYGTRKSHLYGTINLPLKCMTCGHIHGRTVVRKGKKKMHLSLA